MIIIILSFIIAGIFLGNIIDDIERREWWSVALNSVTFAFFLLFGIFSFKFNTQEFPATKYEISSRVTTRTVDTYENEHHFEHIEKDTLYIVKRK